MMQLYGNSLSRAMRCMWMLEEMGLPYELIKKTTRPEDLQSAEYLRLNPNARIPTLVDGWVVIWESMAINLYLAQKYDGPLHITKPEVLGVAAQWSFWAMLETEALLLELLMQRPLRVLDDALSARGYLAADDFTVADLNVASILAWGKMSRLDLSGFSHVAKWLDASLRRPAYGRVRGGAEPLGRVAPAAAPNGPRLPARPE